MAKGYKVYDAKTKAKVAIAVLKNESSLLAICAESKISKTTVIEWRDRLMSEAELIFTPAREQQRVCQKLKSEIASLHTSWRRSALEPKRNVALQA